MKLLSLFIQFWFVVCVVYTVEGVIELLFSIPVFLLLLVVTLIAWGALGFIKSEGVK